MDEAQKKKWIAALGGEVEGEPYKPFEGKAAGSVLRELLSETPDSRPVEGPSSEWVTRLSDAGS